MAESTSGIFRFTLATPMFHPNLLKAQAFKGPDGKPQGEPKFSANFGLDPAGADLRDIKTLCARLAKEQWPGRPLTELATPWVDGNTIADKRKRLNDEREVKGMAKKSDAEFNRGKIIIAARSQFRPALAFLANGRIVEVSEDQVGAHIGKFFFGAEVFAELNFRTYNGVGRNPDGINAYLNGVIATGKGEHLRGRSSLAESFKGYVGSVSNEDPTGDSDEAQW